MTTSTIEIVAAHIKVTDDSLIAGLEDGRTISVPLDWHPRLVHATPQERDNWELYEGTYIHWPDLDEDISIASMLSGRRSAESETSFARWLQAKRAGRPLELSEIQIPRSRDQYG